MNQQNISEKSWFVTFLLCCFFIGSHRLYVGKIGTGILYLLTAGFMGVGAIIDLYKLCTNKFTDSEGKVIVRRR